MFIKKEAILAGDRNQFNLLLVTHFSGALDNSHKELTSAERAVIGRALLAKKPTIEWTDKVVETLLLDIDKNCGPQSEVFKSEIRFSTQVIRKFFGSLCLDKQLDPVFSKLNNLLLAYAVADQDFWWIEHPVKNLVNFICDQMLGWDNTYGSASKSLYAVCESAIDKLLAIPLQDKNALDRCYQEALKDFLQLMEKYTRLANRMKDSEIGLLKAVAAKKIAAQFINKITREQKIPASIGHFLQGKFLHEMQLLIIKQGENSAFWLRWKKLIETAVKHYQSEAGSLTDGSSKSIILNLSNEIEKLAKESLPASDEITEFSNEIAYDFSRKAMGETIDNLISVTPLVIEGEVDGVEKKVTQVLINKARAYPEGQWFLFNNDDGNTLRCRLFCNIPEFNQLLFVSLIGQKSLTLDYEKFAYLLSARHMQDLKEGAHLEQACSLIVDKLMNNFNALYEAKQSQLKRQELEARLSKEENEKRLAAEKARAEAEAIAERKKAEEQKILMAKIADDLKRQARLAINSMAIGSWVDMQCPASKEFQRIKLAVKYNATGRYVFVDADGINVADTQRDDLVELMMKRKLKLLDSDKQFSDRLATIVKNIRQV